MGIIQKVMNFLDFKSRDPLANDLPISFIGAANIQSKPINYTALWNWFKKCPEIIAILNCIIEDIMSDSHYFEGDKEKRDAAEDFMLRTRLKDKLTSFLMDVFVTGDGYLYIGKLKETQVKNLIYAVLGKLGLESKSLNTEKIMLNLKSDASLFTEAKEVEYIPSSTVTIMADEYGHPQKFVQMVGNNKIEYDPEEVIHYKCMDIDGKIYGFTPFSSIMIEMDLLANIKGTALHHFLNGGTPNKMYILKNISMNSPQYKRFKRALEEYKIITNKYRNMVVCAEGGDIEVKDLNPMNKDMEYRELAIYVTQVLIMLWGIPPSRIPNMGGKTGSGSGDQTTSSEGYYRKISHYQDKLESLLYRHIFRDMSVKFRFEKTYLQDEVREAQVDMFHADSILKKQGLLGKYNKRMTIDTLLRGLGLDDDDVEEGDASMQQTNGGSGDPTNRQDQMNNHQLLTESSDKLAKDKNKQKAAEQNP